MHGLFSWFGFAILVAALAPVPASAGEVKYELEKPKRKKDTDPPAFATFTPNDKFAEFKADWTYSLTGVAAQRRLGVVTIDKEPAKPVTQPLMGIGNATKPRNQVMVNDWATGTMFASAQFALARDLLGEKNGSYDARVQVNGSAATNINGATMNADWAFAAAGSTSKLAVSGRAKGGGKWKVVPNGVLNVGGCRGVGTLPPRIQNDLGPVLAGINAACAVKDPIGFAAVNTETSETAAGNLIVWELEAFSDKGSLSLTDGDLLIDTLSGRFFLEIPGVYTQEQGLIDFAFENGIVTRSSTSGIFAGLVPNVGMAAAGTYALGPFSLNYDFGWGETPYDVRFDVASEGSAVTYQLVPEPATWAMLLLGYAAIGIALRAAPARKPRHRI